MNASTYKLMDGFNFIKYRFCVSEMTCKIFKINSINL